MIGLFCRISSVLSGSFAKETYNLRSLLIVATPYVKIICADTYMYIYETYSDMNTHVWIRIYAENMCMVYTGTVADTVTDTDITKTQAQERI